MFQPIQIGLQIEKQIVLAKLIRNILENQYLFTRLHQICS